MQITQCSKELIKSLQSISIDNEIKLFYTKMTEIMEDIIKNEGEGIL